MDYEDVRHRLTAVLASGPEKIVASVLCSMFVATGPIVISAFMRSGQPGSAFPDKALVTAASLAALGGAVISILSWQRLRNVADAVVYSFVYTINVFSLAFLACGMAAGPWKISPEVGTALGGAAVALLMAIYTEALIENGSVWHEKPARIFSGKPLDIFLCVCWFWVYWPGPSALLL
jgi:hypothetical protein